MRKVVLFSLLAVVIFAIGVLADSDNVMKDIKDLGKDKGVVIEDDDIVKINFSDLPRELDIEEVGDTEIAIYEVNHSNVSFFVVSAGGEFEAEPEKIDRDSIMFLNFGFTEERSGSGFLNMAGGSLGSLERGYIMMRKGSVTGISTSLEVVDFAQDGYIEVIIYKNGKEIGFRNFLSAGSTGVKIDYDVMSKGVVAFEAGDILSAYARPSDGVSLEEVTVILEITN